MPDIDIQDRAPINETELFDKPRKFDTERDKSACGVCMEVNYPEQTEQGTFVPVRNHQIVVDGLKNLFNNEHRSGYNYVTGESDGAGVQFTGGLPTEFFNKKIVQGEFISATGEMLTTEPLQENQFAIGNYFLPKSHPQENEAKNLIEESARQNGLTVVGWRNLNTDASVDDSLLSAGALKKKPNMWQAILLPTSSKDAQQTKFDLEQAALKTTKKVAYIARQKKLKINTCSLSGESMVFKGMIRPIQMPTYFKDFSDPNFTVAAVSSHGRFATNTEPDPSRAQPCEEEEIDHNGELNSKIANQVEMRNEAAHYGFKEGYPNPSGSDSMQFTADVANQMLLKDVPKYEAVMRLMPPRPSAKFSAELNAMLQCFQLERTPYDGPAFLTGNKAGYYFAKLDACALRPGRWGVTIDKFGQRKFYAASEDTLVAPEGGKILETGNLDAGGMVMLTPEGELLHTKEILQLIRKRYHPEDPKYFQNLLAKTLVPLITQTVIDHPERFPAREPIGPKFAELNRILYAKGWDYEAIEQVLRHMADYGAERIGSMGDDTNILHSTRLPGHLSAFFHQLFAQVSAPPQDSVNEPENFSLAITLGPTLGSVPDGKQIALDSPILGMDDLYYVENHPDVKSFSLDMSYELDPANPDQASQMREAIKRLLVAAEKAAQKPGGVLIISDKNAGPERIAIPDLIAVAAVRKHLENKKLLRNISIVVDSYQINGPHQSAALLALGADAVYARGAYAKIQQLYEKESSLKAKNYRKATEKCLLKTMGKMGLVNVKNYKGFVAALGLDLSNPDEYALEEQPTLANIFPTIYSPLRGINLGHVADHVVIRHQLAEDPENDFTLMPHSGHFMPEKGGVKHGYGPVVVNAFTDWMKKEETNHTLWRLHTILEERGFPGFVSDAAERFTPENGFLDEKQKVNGRYPVDYLAKFKASPAFKQMNKTLEQYQRENPTSIRSNFSIKNLSKEALRQLLGLPEHPAEELQSTEEIRALIHAGNMSLGALTEPAHRSLRRGMKAVGAFSAAGEGGEDPDDLRDEFETTSSKQIASGRFGVSAMQIQMADEIEIKIAQGAKPGEGGQLPSGKVSVQIAALRGGMPWTNIISPPPHHDIYSIEDLEQLIHDIKSVKASVKVAVKLVASEGIGTIAVGVAKAGADIISVASNDGGTGAAQQSSIKHTGMPSEIAIAEVDRDLRRAKLRDLVELRMSGGFKTIDDIILATILGADQLEFGTTLMITQNCKKQNTCDRSCQPGVAIDGHLFKGKQINTERYIAGLGAGVQARLEELGVSNLNDLKGRTDLLEVLDPELKKLYDFSAILDRSSTCGILRLADSEHLPSYEEIKPLLQGEDCVILFKNEVYFANRCKETFRIVKITEERREHLAQLKEKFGEAYRRADATELVLITQATGNNFLPPRLTEPELAAAKEARALATVRPKEDALVKEIEAFFANNPSGTFISQNIAITPDERSFGARIAGAFVKHLEAYPEAQIILNTSGKAGQSYGFVMPKGMRLNHTGGVQDGFGKSSSGGEFVLINPGQQAVGGNAGFYGGKGVKTYINGGVGHRFGLLTERGVQIVVEETGKSPFEFMLGGTGMILGPVGEGLCGSATGGVVFHYDRYDLCEYKAAASIEKNKLYIQVQGESILYTVVDPKDSEKTITGVMHIKNLDTDFVGPITVEKLQPYLAKMLAITSEKGHTPKNYADAAVRNAWGPEGKAYESAIRTMLQEHFDKTKSKRAREILDSFDLAHFKILIPKTLDNVKTLAQIIDVIQTFHQSESPISMGEQVWLQQKTLEIIEKEEGKSNAVEKRNELAYLLLLQNSDSLFSETLRKDYLRNNLRSLESILEILTLNHNNNTKIAADQWPWLEQKTLELLQDDQSENSWVINELAALFFLEKTANPTSTALRNQLVKRITGSLAPLNEVLSLHQKQQATIAPELRNQLAEKTLALVLNSFHCGLLKVEESDLGAAELSFAEISDSIVINSVIVFKDALFYADKTTQTLQPMHVPEGKKEAVEKLIAAGNSTKIEDPDALSLIVSLAEHPSSTTKYQLTKLAGILRQKNFAPFSSRILGQLLSKISPLERENEEPDFDLKLSHLKPKKVAEARAADLSTSTSETNKQSQTPPVEQRLGGINGSLDLLLADIMDNITAYAAELKHEGTGCSGCRAASCQGGEQVDTGCPSGKKINTINSVLQQVGERPKDGPLTKEQWYTIRKAFELQIEESPFIAYTGAACPAPCQSACTETLPDRGGPDAKRGGKLVGEYVHIKSIEYDLFHLGRALGWFSSVADDQKLWTEEEVIRVFGKEGEGYKAALKRKQDTYDRGIENYKPPFRAPEKSVSGKKLIIIGSGPAAQQMAFEALRDGLAVEMYEKSDKPGGLVTDGIPTHKFDKIYIKEYFSYLQNMGLQLHLNSNVSFDPIKMQFTLANPSGGNPTAIADGNDPNTHVALCVGAGLPNELPKGVVKYPPSNGQESEAEIAEQQTMKEHVNKKIIPATHLLKKFNDIAEILSSQEQLSKLLNDNLDKLSTQLDLSREYLAGFMEGDSKTVAERIRKNPKIYTSLQDILAADLLKDQDPRGKKIIVIGGGDTAQDVIRWLARYFTMDVTHARGHLTVVIRGPKPVLERGIQDSWPAQSQTPTSEYNLKEEELKYVDGDSQYLVEPEAIHLDETTQKLSVQLKQHRFKLPQEILNDPELKKAYDTLPRNERPREGSELLDPISEVDMVITATGFQGSDSLPIVKTAKDAGLTNISFAGDAVTGAKMIVTAQNSGHDTYVNRIKPGLGIDKRVSLSKTLKPTTDLSALAANSIFANSQRNSPVNPVKQVEVAAAMAVTPQ